MTIPALIDLEVMSHLANYGCIKGMDPFALHMLKTSEHPILRHRREWMRREALRQCQEAHQRQEKINEEFAEEPVRRGTTLRRQAVIDPYFADKMRLQHNASWNDKDFIGSVKEANPRIFPSRM